jgi:PPK2 family polyphosphate:nucleotide phosphotransferase
MMYDEFRVRPGVPFRLADVDPGATPGFEKKKEARDDLGADIAQLQALQDVFYAARSHALLIVLQGMDSAGKDSTVKHVMSGVNPEGVDVYSFKAPTDDELAHDFLWRCECVLPKRGHIAIFNRSYYEDVVVVRVHPELLERENEPVRPTIWAERFEDINAFERHLARNSTLVLKFFLHLSKDEQKKRLLARLDDENKNWKFSENDLRERRYWNDYQAAYEEALGATSTDAAPWYVIPADHKWFTQVAVARIIAQQLDALSSHYPRLPAGAAERLEHFRKQLEAE